MHKFIIERDTPGVGQLTPEELKNASQLSCKVLRALGPDIEWVHSYVTANKLYCLYRAPSEDLIRQYAANAGFPASSVSNVSTTITPATAAEPTSARPTS